MKRNLLFNQLTAIGKRLAMVLTVLFTLGVGSMLGAEVTFTASEDYSSFSGSPLSLTKAGVTVSGFGSVQSSDLRLYKGSTLNISSTNTISSIEFTFTNSSNNGGWNGNSSTYAVSGLSTKTWSKTATSGNSGKQARITKIIVKYESQAQQSYSVVLDRNGAQETINNVASGTLLDDIDGNGEQGGCAEWSFVGWSKSQRSDQDDSTPMDLVTEVDGAGPYYAVYSHTADGGGGSTTKTISSFSAISGTIGDVSYTANKGGGTSNPQVSSNAIRLYQNASGNTGGYIVLSVPEGYKITSATIKSTMATTTGYYIASNPGSSTPAKANFVVSNKSLSANTEYTVSGLSTQYITFACFGTSTSSRLYLSYLSVTYSGGQTVYYTTNPQCTTQPTYNVTSIPSHVTADGGNPTTITSEDTELELSYSADTDWNLPENITITMGGNELTDSEYVWDNENGDLLIQPTSGFTGNIVVTINGWQQLATPTGLNVLNITSSGATLEWNAVTHATSYTVQVYGENDEIIAEYTDLTQTTKEVSGLESDTYYIWAVTAIGDGTTYTDSEESETTEFTTSSATCTVTYNANGGIGTPPSDETEYTNGATVTVLGNYGKLTKDGCAFTGWNTKADGTGTPYEAGETFPISANTPLYAQWCEAHWALVTSTSEIENDTRIVIAAKDEAVALSTTQNETNRGQATIEKKYNTIKFDVNTQILSLVDVTDNKFTLYTGSGYLYAASNSANQLKTGNTLNNNYNWSIAISQDAAIILAQGTNTNNQLKYNSTSDLFSCYGSTNSQKDVVIYKEVCVQDQYNVASTLTNATAVNTNPTTVDADATSLTLNYSANTGYLLPETITVKMGGALLVATTDYTWDKATGALTINVTGFYGDIDVKIVAEEDPCYGFAMSEVTATSTTPNSVTLTWTEVTGATGYNVRLGDGAFTAATGLTHTFTGLNPKTSYTWEVQAVKDGADFHCEASKTGSTTTQKERFTVSWIVNGNTESPYATETVVDGNSITQYPSAPSAPSGCHEKVFVGWTNTPINTPRNEAPDILYKQKSDVPAITANTTLHAVWADVIGGGETTKSLLNNEIISFHKQGTTTSYSDLTVPSADGDWSGLFCTANSNSVYTINLKKDLVNENRPYLKSSEYNNITKVSVIATHTSTKGNRTLYLCNAATNSPESNNIGTISIAKDNNSSQLCTLSSSATTLYLYVDNGIQIKTITLTTGGTTTTAYTTLCDECTPSTLTLEADNTTADLDINGKATITFSTTGGNGGEITYAANPEEGVTWENGTATFKKAGEYSITASQGKNGENCPTTSNTVNVTITAIPHLYFVTEPANPIVFDPVECGGNTRVEDKKSVSVQAYNLAAAVTAQVTGPYKIARTSGATLNEYTTSLTLRNNITDGKINSDDDVIYILSFPPAGSSEPTEGTLTFTTTNDNTLTVNLSTPTVTCTQYTLTLNDRGTKTTAKYYADASVPKPEDPTGVCTDPIHYVFDGWATSTVAGGSTTYTKVSFPYTMPAKNTTLYAVYRYTEENANPDKFMSVDKGIGELVSGMDYVLTGYYNTDGKEYALSCTQYESGKYKTKQIDVSESTTMYDEENPYYELTTTDNEIIWTITGDDENGYSFQNKSTGKYLNMEESSLVLNDNNPTKYTIDHYEAYDNELGDYVTYLNMIIQPLEDYSYYLSSYYKNSTAGVLFNLHSSSTLQLYLYKRATSYLYTTSPACGPMLEITSGKDIYVTSGYGTGRNTVIAQQTVEYRATRLKTQNGSAEGTAPDVKVAANGVTMGGVVTNKVKVVELTQNKEQIGDKYTITGTVTVQYTPTANNLQEEIQVQLAVDYNTDAKDNFTVHARSLPSEFVIAAKQGDKWYALNGDMNGNDAEPANGQITVDNIDNPTIATYAPCNTIYTFDGMVDGGNKEYMRFQGIDGKYLWSASEGNTGIQNYASNTPAADALQYNWKLSTTDNVTYRFGNGGNTRLLGLNNNLKFGMYATSANDLHILPIQAKCLYNYAPTNLKVSVLKSKSVTLTWDAVSGATKYQYSTNGTAWTDAGTEPTVTINGLNASTNYTYYIRAYHEDAGVSQECIDYSQVSFTTANCDDVPTNITYVAGIDDITLSWSAIASTATITLYSDAEGANEVKTISSAESPCKIDGLNKATTYYVRISTGESCHSQLVEVVTEVPIVDITNWKTDGIDIYVNTDDTIQISLENEVQKGSGEGSVATELFISKYFEATSNVKLIALFNGTNSDIDLSNYSLGISSLGADKTCDNNCETTYSIKIPFNEDIPETNRLLPAGKEIILISYQNNKDGEEFVGPDGTITKVNTADIKVLACAAESQKSGWASYIRLNTPPLDFSGNDAIALFKHDGDTKTLIDIIGAGTTDYADLSNVVSKVTTPTTFMDAAGWYNAEGYQIMADGSSSTEKNYALSTNRCLLIRKNSVTSGENAVDKNTNDFVTLGGEDCEWMGLQIPDEDNACEGFEYVGGYDYSEYYTTYDELVAPNYYLPSGKNPDGTWSVTISNLGNHSCKNLKITVKDINSNVLVIKEFNVPIIIATNQDTKYGESFTALPNNLGTVIIGDNGQPTGEVISLTAEEVKNACKECDVIIRDGATLSHIEGGIDQFQNITIYPTAKLSNINVALTVNKLMIQSEIIDNIDTVGYAIIEKQGGSLTANAIGHTKRIDAQWWYPFSLPYDCDIADITQANGESMGEYGVHWGIQYYDGKRRQEEGTSASLGHSSQYWTPMGANDRLNAHQGYVIALFDASVQSPTEKRTIYFPPVDESKYTESGDDAKKTDVYNWNVNLNAAKRHHGWNFTGSPYISMFNPSVAGITDATLDDILMTGYYKGKYSPFEDTYKEDGKVYITAPIPPSSLTYKQTLATATSLKPFAAYFVQTIDPTTNGNETKNLTYVKGGRELPASAPARAAATKQRVLVELNITAPDGQTDNTGIWVDERYTTDYEIAADLTKMYATGTRPQLYTLAANNEKLAYNALPDNAATNIPLGLYAPKAGDYTLTLNERVSRVAGAETVELLYNNQVVANLLYQDYTITANKGTVSGYSLSIRRRADVSTAVDNTTGNTITVIANDGYISLVGVPTDAQVSIYDMVGRLINTQYANGETVVNMPIVPQGVYNIVVANGTGYTTIKSVVK